VLRSHYHLSLEETGAALSATSFGTLPALIPWGQLADRVGERIVGSLGLTVAAGALAAASITPSFPVLLALLVAAGAFGSSASAASGRAVMYWFDRSRRGLALGIRQMAVPLGGLVAALSLPALADAGGLQAAFALLAGFCALGAAASALVLREAPGGLAGEEIPSERHPLRDRRIWLLCGASALLITGQVAATGFTVLFLHERHGLSTAAAGGILAVALVLGALARVAAGHWSDRLGTRTGPLRVLALGLAAALVAVALAVPGPTAVVAVVLVLAGGLGMSWNGLSFTAAAELSGHARAGAAVGMQQTVLNASAAVSPVVFAALVGASSWEAGFGLAALFPLAAVLALRRLRA
jgi:MFS family permease